MSAKTAVSIAIVIVAASLGASLIHGAQRDTDRPPVVAPPWSGYRLVDLTHSLGPENPILAVVMQSGPTWSSNPGPPGSLQHSQ